MQAALDLLRSELATLDTRRTHVIDAIAAVQRLVDPTAPVVDPKPDVTPRDPVGAVRVGKLLAAERKAAVSRKSDEDCVVDLLLKRGSLTPKEVGEHLAMEGNRVSYLLKKLRGSGTIVADGETRNRVVRLAHPPRPRIAPALTEELVPVWDGSTKRSPEDVLREQRETRA